MSEHTSLSTLEPTVSLRDRVYQFIKNQIIEGHFTPSDTLTGLSISKQLGISRTPVREALQYLEKEGLLEALPKKGFKVRPVDQQELEEICEIRCALESIAIKWAAKRITPSQINALEENIMMAEKKMIDGDLTAFGALDEKFHELVALASGSQQLVNIILSLRNDMIRSRFGGLNSEGITRAFQGHKKILKCLVERETDCAERVIRDHLENLKMDAIKKEAK